MHPTYDVVALGELLIDLTPSGHSQQKHPLYEQNTGGAPANVLACLSALGRKSALICKVGDDFFGTALHQSLVRAGIDSSGLVWSKKEHTTLAFVHLGQQGERSFTFYRQPGADQLLNEDEIDESLIHKARLFHVGTLSLTGQPSRAATFKAIEAAQKVGLPISCDINYREPLWPSSGEAKEMMERLLESVSILKVSEEELFLLTGLTDADAGSRILFNRFPLQLILITRGAQGSDARTRQTHATHPAFNVKSVDTTGAGDAFMGAILDQLLATGQNLDSLEQTTLQQWLAFANAAGALVTERYGAFDEMPAREAIERCLKTNNVIR